MSKELQHSVTDMRPRASLKSTVKTMAENTTMHGLPNAVKASGYFRKCFWFVAAFSGIAAFTWQIATLVSKYSTYPTTTSVDIKIASEMKFPAITFCNINPIRNSSLSKVQNISGVLNSTEPKKARTDNSTGTTHAYNKTVAVYQSYTSLDRKTRMKIGHNLTTMLMFCNFAGYACDESHFSRFLNYKYGNCYVFNSGHNFTNVRNVTRTGPENELRDKRRISGLTSLVLELYVEHDHEYIKDISDSVGIKLVIHNQTSMPFPEDSGYSISVGTKTAVSLSKTQIERMKAPHGTCQEINAEQNKILNMYSEEEELDIAYTQEGCLKTCYQNNIILRCECCSYNFRCVGFSLYGLIEKNITTCQTTNETNCEKEVAEDFKSNALGCQEKCPTPCSEIVYSADISSATWPSSLHTGKVMADLRKSSSLVDYAKWSKTKQTDFARENVLKIEVYFRTLNYENIQTEPAYSDVSLISDIGGQMGMWLGLSVLTLVELIELLVDIVALAFSKTGKTGSVEHKSDDVTGVTNFD